MAPLAGRRTVHACAAHAARHDWCNVLALAAKIGVTDAMVGNKARTRNELVGMLATEYRNGHAAALKAAYSAGRFHVDVMGKD